MEAVRPNTTLVSDGKNVDEECERDNVMANACHLTASRYSNLVQCATASESQLPKFQCVARYTLIYYKAPIGSDITNY